MNSSTTRNEKKTVNFVAKHNVGQGRTISLSLAQYYRCAEMVPKSESQEKAPIHNEKKERTHLLTFFLFTASNTKNVDRSVIHNLHFIMGH